MYIFLIITALSGFTSNDVKYHSFEMNSKEACYRAAEEAASNSTYQTGFRCISKETGESKMFLGKSR